MKNRLKQQKMKKQDLIIMLYNDKLKRCFAKIAEKEQYKIIEKKQTTSEALKKILDERKIPQIEKLRQELDFERSKNREAVKCIGQLRQENAKLKLVINALRY